MSREETSASAEPGEAAGEGAGSAAPPGSGATAADRKLVERLRAGDPAAFTALVETHSGAMIRIAAAYVPSRAVAEEVVQETWLAVIEGLDRFEGRSSLKTWIFRILVNRARTRGVREARGVPFSALDEDGAAEPSPDAGRFTPDGRWATPPARWAEDTPERVLLRAEGRARVEEAIGTLPPRQRAVISLRDVEGWTSEEVCNALGLAETHQRVLLHRARSHVRRALERYLGGERP